ncbi:MAG: hypothetical protein COA43_13800 [Robiginitomaculum sp.]|nr:MAG: hypothetical protein COA43_13800 [Robiginitomaculum sp.]
MKNLMILFTVVGLGLSACNSEEMPPVPEAKREPQSEIHAPKTIGPVTVIHCTLKNYHTGQSTTGTYFTYDTRTIDMPSQNMIEADNMDAANVEWFKEHISRYRLQDALIVLPLKQQHNKFRVDIENTWYLHGLSMQFVWPDPIWGDNLGAAQFVTGAITFGDKISNVDGKKRMIYEGALSLSSGNQYGGTAGTWTYYGKGDVEPKDREWGYLRCGPKQADPDSIRVPSGL